jgi:hypothetical protein
MKISSQTSAEIPAAIVYLNYSNNKFNSLALATLLQNL